MLRRAQNSFVRRVGNGHFSSSAAPGENAQVAKVTPAASPFSKFRSLRPTSFGGVSIDKPPVLAQFSSSGNQQAAPVQRTSSSTDDARATSRAAPRGSRRTDLGWSDGLSRSFAGRMQVRQQTGTLLPPTPPGEDRSQQDRRQPRGPTSATAHGNGPVDRAQRPSRGANQQQGARAGSTGADSRQSSPKRARQDTARSPVKSAVTEAFKLQMSTRESTDLNMLFKASAAPTFTQGRRVPAFQLVDSRIWTTLERKGGDYSRHVPRYVSGKSLLRPMRYARFVLGTRKDLEVERKQKTMQIIAGFAGRRPQGEVRA
ncbi:hypothetical protein OF83DRAFT_1090214 [Amylostereum chailletii]|nr:hypothetical protein OF83DRAFT_1090214 [Amylostereum chailletii]